MKKSLLQNNLQRLADALTTKGWMIDAQVAKDALGAVIQLNVAVASLKNALWHKTNHMRGAMKTTLANAEANMIDAIVEGEKALNPGVKFFLKTDATDCLWPTRYYAVSDERDTVYVSGNGLATAASVPKTILAVATKPLLGSTLKKRRKNYTITTV